MAAQLESAALWPGMAVVDRFHPDRRSGVWPPLLWNGRVFGQEVVPLKLATERWPVQYEDLEPSYERIERFLDVQTLPTGVAYDLPTGGRRLVQRAEGYTATVVAGQVTYRDGAPTTSPLALTRRSSRYSA